MLVAIARATVDDGGNTGINAAADHGKGENADLSTCTHFILIRRTMCTYLRDLYFEP